MIGYALDTLISIGGFNKILVENFLVKARVEELEKMLTPEMADLDAVQKSFKRP